VNKSAVAVFLTLLVLCGGLSYAKTHKRGSKEPTTAKGPTTASPKASGSRSQGRARRSPATARRSTQQAPTPERYREIQQALANKGYLKSEVNGQWGSDSTEALKRFQTEQNLAVSGKLDAASLIALGLGPKRNLSAHSTTESRPKDENRRPEGSERP
jgi:peptidoglycan hydrolase-like protein with peptidoglycan-binding domain